MSDTTATWLDLEDVAWPAPEQIDATRVLQGSPAASTVIVEDDMTHQLGLWRISPGVFTTDHVGYAEYVHILSGNGRLVAVDGTTITLRRGVTVLMQPGWKGRWEVERTITKVYTVLYSTVGTPL